jgi:phospholipase C
MQGFVESGGDETMACFAMGHAPVLQTLAQTFVVFDRWFSSLPGPTWPNRFFVHAASSGGLTNSPKALTALGAITIDRLAFEFEHGSIYDRLDAARLPWRVYHGDHFPQALAIKRHVEPFVRGSRNFEWIRPGERGDPFAADLNSGAYDATYAFIEPDYSIFSGMYSGDSQHPRGRVSSGEALIKYVYETLRNSPVWQESALVVTYDEHGGFFDHVAPDPCAAPGDRSINYGRSKKPYPYDFARYGARVPAVLISPWVDA